jgi:hypothetical protein
MSDLQPGDHFIQKLFVNDVVVFVYGFFERRTPEGMFAGYIDHNAGVILDGRVLSEAQHELVGVISAQAYAFAQKQGWPNDELGVSRVLRYSERPHGFTGALHRLRRVFSR